MNMTHTLLAAPAVLRDTREEGSYWRVDADTRSLVWLGSVPGKFSRNILVQRLGGQVHFGLLPVLGDVFLGT
jgi:hypothetical protein